MPKIRGTVSIRFSVIIPTFNHCEMLRQALIALCNQDCQDILYEIIVVNHKDATDNTPEMVQGFTEKCKVPVYHIYVQEYDKHYAVNTGFKIAHGEILGLIDDDVIVDAQWIRNIVKVYDNPEVSCAGGKLTLRWINGTPPDWIEPFREVLGEINYGDKLIELKYPQMINAGNFSIRKEILCKVGGYNPCNALGDKLVGDGESGLCLKVYEAGGRIFWVPGASGWHVQDVQRVTPAHIRRKGKYQGMSNAYTIYRSSGGSIPQVFRKAYQRNVGSMLKIASILLKCRHIKLWKSKINLILFEINTSLALVSYLFTIYTNARLRKLVTRIDWINES